MQVDPAFELYMLEHLAEAMAVYGNGEGLAIAGDLDLCYWCERPEPCTIDHSAREQELLDERLGMVRCQLGLEFNC